MTAYVIAEIEITDPLVYEQYRARVDAVNEKYNGRFLARGGKLEALEGGWSPKRVVIVEFPGMEDALRWYHSTDYAPLIELRKKASHFKMIIVDGV